MSEITLDVLLDAAAAGGPSCLTSATELAPAGGQLASVAPAKFAGPDGGTGTYAWERRFVDGELAHAVVVDSKQSQLNRLEQQLQLAIDDDHPVLRRLPRVALTYHPDGSAVRLTDLQLPHRVFDGHIRAGSTDGVPVTEAESYRAARDATPSAARALFDLSPTTLIFGGWDSSRRSGQGRWRSVLVGEIIGVVGEKAEARRGGARVDPMGMQIQVDGTTMTKLAKGQRSELSPKLFDKIVKEAARKPEERRSASALGLGGIPPSLDQLAGVSCERIVRTHVLSFATLRQMRFGAGVEGDAACRALLAALALNGLARSDAELVLRANCDLVEAGETAVKIDRRGGRFEELAPLTISAADALLAAALERAERLADVRWEGVVLEVTGNPEIVAGAVDAETGE